MKAAVARETHGRSGRSLTDCGTIAVRLKQTELLEIPSYKILFEALNPAFPYQRLESRNSGISALFSLRSLNISISSGAKVTNPSIRIFNN